MLTKEAPVYQRPVERPKLQDQLEQFDLSNLAGTGGFGFDGEASHRITEHRLEGMGLPAIRSFRAQQYGGSPGADAAVIRLKGTEKGLALTVDGNSRYCYLDPYVGGL